MAFSENQHNGSIVKTKNVYNPKDTFDKRRNIYKLLLNQQKREHTTLEQIKMITINHKRIFLTELAKWLMNQKLYGTNEQIEIEQITKVDLKEWCDLNSMLDILKEKLDYAKGGKNKAESEYRELAPFGFFSRFFSNKEDNPEMFIKYDEYLRMKREFELANYNYNQHINKMRIFAYEFFKICSVNINKLFSLQRLGIIFQNIFNEMNEEIEKVWMTHISEIQNEFFIIKSDLVNLESFYIK